MIRRTISLALLGAAGAAVLPAQATDVFRLEGYGAESRAMGGTAVAQDVGPAGMMTNPATLSLMPQANQFTVGLDVVSTDITVTDNRTGESVSSSTHSNNRGPYFAPELGYAHHSGPWAFGVGAYAQGGLGTEYGSNSFLSRATGGVDTGLENSSRLLVLNIPFAASYQVNDQLSLGAGVDAVWQGLNLNLLFGADQVGSLIGAGRASGALVGTLGGMGAGLAGAHISLTENHALGSGIDAWGYTGRLGLVYRATPETTLGASYTAKSQVADMSGRATLTAVTTIAGVGDIPLAGNIKLKDFQMPAVLTLGLSQRLSPEWTMSADVSRVFWKDALKDLKVAFVADGGGDLNLQLPQNYQDQTILALGAAWQMNKSLTLRGGLRLAQQALPSDTLFAVIPATPKRHIAAGFTYAFSDAAKLEFAYSHAFEETMSNAGVPNTSDPISVRHAQDNLSFNYNYAF